MAARAAITDVTVATMALGRGRHGLIRDAAIVTEGGQFAPGLQAILTNVSNWRP